MFDLSSIKDLHLELSSHCNAACPTCRRTTDENFDSKLHGTSLTVKKIKQLFDESFIKNLTSILFCGNYGDPAAAPECLDILRYFIGVNPNILFNLHTNGGIRNKEWWSEFGVLFSIPSRSCTFNIDGLKNTNHIHRVNTNFDKIIENASAFIDAGGNAIWTFLVYRHNEHQVTEARELAMKLGFNSFIEKVSRRIDPEKYPTLLSPLTKKYL